MDYGDSIPGGPRAAGGHAPAVAAAAAAAVAAWSGIFPLCYHHLNSEDLPTLFVTLTHDPNPNLNPELIYVSIFTALHVMQTRYCDEISVRLSVCPSVCLSVRRVICDKMEERSVQIFIPYERTFSLVF